jgi:hypothetical protein
MTAQQHEFKNKKRESKADNKRDFALTKLANAAVRINEQRDNAYFEGYA